MAQYLECEFNDITHVTDVELRIDTQVFSKQGSFRYLGSIIQDGEIIDDVTHRIGAGWMNGSSHPMFCVIRMYH